MDRTQCKLTFKTTQNAPVEETELNYPVRIPRYSLIPDSDDPGRMRGGLGLWHEYIFVDHEAVFTTLADCVNYPARGLSGGGRGTRRTLFAALQGKDCRPPFEGNAAGETRAEADMAAARSGIRHPDTSTGPP